MAIGAALNLLLKVVHQASKFHTGCLSGFHPPLTTACLGHDNQGHIYALNQLQIGLQNFPEDLRDGASGGGVTPRITTLTAGVKGKGFKSSPLSPNEEDTTDGIERKGIGVVKRGGDGSTHFPDIITEDGELM